MKQVTLIVPHVDDWPARDDDASRWPVLARLAGRGGVSVVASSATLRPWQRACLESAGLARDEGSYASAPICRLASDDASGIWLHAEPVHLAAGLETLQLVRLTGAARVTAEECEAVRATLEPHLRAHDIALEVLADGSWVAQWRGGSALTFTWPEDTTDVAAGLPRGADAAPLTRVMTELQMLLHDHAVNRQRERRQLPPINAIWFCGGGAMKTFARAASLPDAFGAEPFLAGLYRAHGVAAAPAPRDADDLLSRGSASGKAIAVVPPMAFDDVERRWAAPLADALGASRVSRIEIVAGRHLLTADRGAVRRFWRKALAPGQWPT